VPVHFAFMPASKQLWVAQRQPTYAENLIGTDMCMMKNILLSLTLFILAACANTHSLSPSSSSNNGEEKLNALFAEGLNYIQNQGGPYITDEDTQKQTELLFWNVDHPYCPHCPVALQTTADQEIAYTKTIQTKAESGDSVSQYLLAVRYLEGKGISQSSKQGIFLDGKGRPEWEW